MKKNYKVCPRCKTKERLQNPKCRNCGLIFDRLKNVTNRAGIKALKNKEYNKVLYMTTLPKDVSWLKLFLTCLFFGWLGVHFYKVGRQKWFFFDIIAFFFAIVYATVLTFFNVTMADLSANYLGFFLQLLSFPFAFSIIIWVGSLIQILTKTFKVPVAIDEEYFVEENIVDEKVAEDILKQVETNRKEELEKKQEDKKNKGKRKFFCPNCGQYVKVKKGESVCPICDEPLK